MYEVNLTLELFENTVHAEASNIFFPFFFLLMILHIAMALIQAQMTARAS